MKPSKHYLRIELGCTEVQYWRDVCRYRGLFYFLAWRDILVHHKQTSIRVGWALICPFLTMIVLTIVFEHLAKLPSEENAPYPIFSAMLPWQFFASALTECSSSLWLAALNVQYRDSRYIVFFIVQLGLYISPVGFSSIVPQQWRLLYSLNPMVGVIDSFRWASLGNNVALYWTGFIISMFLVSAILISGVVYSRRMERTFADVI